MSKTALIIIGFLLIETLLAFSFAVVAQLLYKKIGFDFPSITKGIAERLFLAIALINGQTGALTFFSALKLATRLKHTEPSGEGNNKFNDYYLIGNLASVAVAILYVYLWNNFERIHIFQKLIN